MWTKEIPKKEGYYWMLSKFFDLKRQKPVVVKVFATNTGYCIQHDNITFTNAYGAMKLPIDAEFYNGRLIPPPIL